MKAVIVALLVFLAGFFAVAGGRTALKMRSRGVESLDDVPLRFPVVIVLRQESQPRAICRVAWYADLRSGAYERMQPSYLVREDDVSTCKEEIAAQREFVGRDPGDPDGTLPIWSSFVELSPVSPDGTQEIELSATWDDDVVNRGWYQASASGVRPLRYQDFHAGDVLAAFSEGLAAGIVLAVVATTIFVRRQRVSAGS